MTTMTWTAARRRADRAASWMRLEADEWGVSLTSAWVLAIAPIVFAGLAASTVVHRPLYRAVINEDGFVEWAQLLVLVALVPMGIALAVRLWRLRERTFALLFAIAAIGAFLIAGEEISWGQRILGWATPNDLAQLNVQGETNVHNIGNVLAFLNLGMFVITVVAGVMPFIWKWGSAGRLRDVATTILVPPLFLASSFLFAGAYRLARYSIFPESGYVISRYGEVGELLLYGALLVFAILIYRKLPTLPVRRA
jgi:hypothetical protein